jgi:hypothetical protein
MQNHATPQNLGTKIRTKNQRKTGAKTPAKTPRKSVAKPHCTLHRKTTEGELRHVGHRSCPSEALPKAIVWRSQQRIGVWPRTIVLEPKFIVLDEPTSALDMSVQAQIVDLLRDFKSGAASLISSSVTISRWCARLPAKSSLCAMAESLTLVPPWSFWQSRAARTRGPKRARIKLGHRLGHAPPRRNSLRNINALH